jgi:hypothetical protein
VVTSIFAPRAARCHQRPWLRPAGKMRSMVRCRGRAGGPVAGQRRDRRPPDAGCRPTDTRLRGLPIASQCLGMCPGGGTTLSNCLSWVLQGN